MNGLDFVSLIFILNLVVNSCSEFKWYVYELLQWEASIAVSSEKVPLKVLVVVGKYDVYKK